MWVVCCSQAVLLCVTIIILCVINIIIADELCRINSTTTTCWYCLQEMAARGNSFAIRTQSVCYCSHYQYSRWRRIKKGSLVKNFSVIPYWQRILLWTVYNNSSMLTKQSLLSGIFVFTKRWMDFDKKRMIHCVVII